MSDVFPLLVGDEVQAVGGPFAGRIGRVTAIGHGETIHVYFGTLETDHPDGSHSVISEADEFSQADLSFRCQPVARSIVRPDLLAAPPPRESGLEATALAAIGDDTTRLVYADWLEDRADPHADYLRVQVALGQAVRANQPFEHLADRERRLRAVLNPDWVSQFRRLTTQPPPFDVAALDPAYATHARTSVRLHPRSGDVPDPAASKLGGLFLWPAEEPWPTAEGVAVDTDFPYFGEPLPDDWSKVSLVPLIQLARRDVPQILFPSGTDLMQVFWCPFFTSEHAPEPFVFWRNSADVKSPRREPPQLDRKQASGCIPTPSRLYPEQITEYPVDDEVPVNDALRQGVRNWAATWLGQSSAYSYWWNRCTGWKVGGYPWVNQSDCLSVGLTTPEGRPMEYLLQVSESELHHTNWRWCPVEDRNLCFNGAGWGTVCEGGGLSVLSRGNYHLLVDRAVSPWLVRSFHDSVG